VNAASAATLTFRVNVAGVSRGVLRADCHGMRTDRQIGDRQRLVEGAGRCVERQWIGHAAIDRIGQCNDVAAVPFTVPVTRLAPVRLSPLFKLVSEICGAWYPG